MMRKRSWLILSVLLFLFMGCQMLSGIPDVSLPGGASGGDSSADSIFTTPDDPVSADVSLDSDLSVEKTISLEGGEIQAEGADGTLFTLNIPGDALEQETTIKMTPAEVSGLPFGSGEVLSVQLEPEGLTFLNYVTLTITPKVEIPINEQLFFGFQAGGEDVILIPPVVDSPEIKLQLLHFSGAGVTKGLLADMEPVRERLGGDAERRIQSQVAEQLMRERQRQLLGGDESASNLGEIFQDAFDRYEKEVVAPRIAAAGESCAAGRLALQTVFGMERQKQLLGAADDAGLSKYAGLIDTVTQVCMKEEYELCVNDHIIHRMIPVVLGMERQRQLLGSTDSAQYQQAMELVAKCLTFELEFHSEADFDDGSDGGYNSIVNAKIPLRFDPGEMRITGSTALVNTDFEFRVADCSVDSQRGGSSVAVQSLVPITDSHSPSDELGYVRDFRLLFFPERTTEAFTVKCEDSPPYSSGPSGLWSAVYLVLHEDEIQMGEGEAAAAPPEPDIASMMESAMSGFAMPMLPVPMMTAGSGFLVQDWEVFGKEYFAKKEWIKEEGSLGITEVGTLKLYHRPGK